MFAPCKIPRKGSKPSETKKEAMLNLGPTLLNLKTQGRSKHATQSTLTQVPKLIDD